MKESKIIAEIIVLILITTAIISSEALSLSISKQNEEKNCSILATKLVYVGSMTALGTGEFETSTVNSSSEKNLKISVGRKGSDLLLQAKYYLECPGLLDHAFAKLWVNNGNETEIDTDDFTEGYLFILLENCKPGDFFYWTLTTIYDDLLFPYPLFDFDDGSAFCRINKAKFRLFDNLKERFRFISKIICVV